MSDTRPARSRFYDGVAYGTLVDPLLAGVHAFVAKHIPEGRRVLDACCGTGALSKRLAATGRDVVGIDLSPRNIAYAKTKRQASNDGSLAFEVGDVAHLTGRARDTFDIATIVLALHEMPEECRVPVLREIARVARRVFIVDYQVPMPWNASGLRNRAIELAAGREHFTAFRNFSRRGGLPSLVSAAGLNVESERTLDRGTLAVHVLRGATDAAP